MERHAMRLLVLSLVLGAAAIGYELNPRGRSSTAPARPAGEATREAPSTPSDAVAWECVPDYWWGYWTWAWEPCAWLDRKYVEGTIGAIATATAPASEAR